MFETLYVLTCFLLCFVRYKNICKDCDTDDIIIDMFQIIILFILLRYVIVPIVFFKCIGMVFLSYFIKKFISIFIYKKKKVKKTRF